jgi:uncharacterized membrane protein
MAKKTTTTTKKKTTTTSKKAAPARKTTPTTTARDAEQGKVMSVIAYIGILCLIPIITGDYKKSPFVKYHLNQGLVLFIAWIAWLFVSMFLGFIFNGWFLMLLFGLVRFAVWVGVIVLVVLGIINAVNGRMRPLPVIGSKFEIIK